ncbi:Zinc transporter ZTP29 [Morella rubra]|uniref:Zinc transporter ZTP29 n=1 Tax=Morella rubra TaxID=262757 RepID=A0A6A1V010_9ROSI|nr:Zinc transporter ZTP29 [Morella rubra]
MDSQILVALALSLVGGMSTSLGALFVILNQAPNLKVLGLLQGFAAGLMLSISFLDLAHNAINSIGFLKANLWKTGGEDGKDIMKKHRRQVLYSGIVTAIGISLHNFPEGMGVPWVNIPNNSLVIVFGNVTKLLVSFLSGKCSIRELDTEVGLGSPPPNALTAISQQRDRNGDYHAKLGALFVILNQAPNLKVLGLLQGFAAGLMLSISFLDLAHNAINSIGFLKANLWKTGGEDGKDIMKKHRRQVLYSGIVTAIGISLHNFPEGMAVFLGSMKGLRVGVNLALAIALHNIPEGVAVALPVYFATQSKWQAFKLASLSGFAEPLGVVIVAYLFPSSLSPEILEGLLGSVGGVMAFLTLHEMLPLAFDYAGQKQAVKAVFFGMAFMSASLYFLEISLPKEMSL